jgi:hypothetical protein
VQVRWEGGGGGGGGGGVLRQHGGGTADGRGGACSPSAGTSPRGPLQGVGGALAVDAYQTHARLALEDGDWAEFRRCHAVLRSLYQRGQAVRLTAGRAGWRAGCLADLDAAGQAAWAVTVDGCPR